MSSSRRTWSLFSVFVFFPLVYAAYISLHEWSLIDTPTYVGAKNYGRLFNDPQFWQSLQNTVIFSVVTVPTSLFLGLMVAIGLNRELATRTLLRSLYFLPVVVSSVATRRHRGLAVQRQLRCHQ